MILEPSAGVGILADGIKSKFPTAHIHCVELNATSKDELVRKGYDIVGCDFFLFNPTILYDKVIGAPNFRDNIDTEHIIKMYNCTKSGGRIISLTSPYWMTGDSERQICFREWLSDKNYFMTMLSDNSFMEQDNTVPTAIIVIDK